MTAKDPWANAAALAGAPAGEGRAGLRLRRVRIADPAWAGKDSGPLLVGPRLLAPRLGRYPDGVAESPDLSAGVALEADAPYPRAAPGPFTPAAWQAMPPRSWQGNAVALAAGALALAPALSILDPGRPAALAASAGLAAAGALFGHAAAIGALRRRRAAALAVHSRAWDRALTQSARVIGALPLRFAGRLRAGLAAAHESALNAPQVQAAAIRWAAALLVASAAIGWEAGIAVGASLAAFAAAAWLARTSAALDHVARLRRTRALRSAAHHAQMRPHLALIGGSDFLLGRAQRTEAAAASAEQSAARALAFRDGARRAATVLAAVAVPLAAALWGPPAGPGLGLLVAGFASAVAADAAAEVGLSAGRGGLRRRRMWRAGAPLKAPQGRGRDAGPVQAIEARGVHFRFPGACEDLLRGVDLSVARGEAVAIAGPSGTGKSTFLRILVGLLQPTSGEVRVNGAPLGDADEAAYRGRIGAVFQDGPLGFTTVRHAIGGPALSLAEVEAAARLAGLDGQIQRLPMGYQTLVVSGVFPSGLLERLRIARALAGSPDVVVLDEALSVLGVGAAARLLATLKARGAAVLFCSHLPEILALADRISPLGPLGQQDAAMHAMSESGAAPVFETGPPELSAEDAKRRAAAQRIFRPAALERLSSPEQLDAPITIPDSERWSLVWGAAALAGSLLAWFALPA